MIDVSLLQSLVALNGAHINRLHNGVSLFMDMASETDCDKHKADCVAEASRKTKLIAKYAKLQRALKQEIAEYVWEERAAQIFYKRIAAL